ncbi:MAG: site-specific integrase [Chloroflexi bacterium]|nr:MAG: site-specific integrase [Chloroflexota bacterium]
MKWAFVLDIGSGSKREQMHRSGFATEKEAAARRAAALAQLNDGTFVAPSKVTFGDHLDRWLENSVTQGWSPNTRRIRETAVMHAKRRLADVPLQALEREHFRRFFAWLLREGKIIRTSHGVVSGPMKPRSVASIYGSLRLALSPAVEDRLIRFNPVIGTFKTPKDGGGEEMQTWTLEELRAFLHAIAGRRDAGLFATALATGMRRGELLGLRWRDVDLVGGRINVRRQWTMAGDKGWRFQALKTGTKAMRTIEIDRFTAAILERQRELVTRERVAWGGAYTNKDLVFPYADGRPQDGSQVTRRFKYAISQCPDVPMMVFHGCRHTHATLLLEDGVSLKVVAQRLGDHENTVLRNYGHVLPRGAAIAASRVAAWLDDGEADRSVSDEAGRLRAEVDALRARLAAYEPAGHTAEHREQSVSGGAAEALVPAGTPDDSY